MIFLDASNFVEGSNRAFYIIMGIGFFFLIGLTTTMLYFSYRYNKKRNPVATQIVEKPILEITWIVIPLIIVLFMFYYGYIAFKPMREAPSDAYQITTIGKMWEWNFIYPNGKESKKLVVPLNKPIKLKLISLDVVHSIYIPAFRIKEDMVKGEPDFMWFVPTQLGRFDIFCAEYCGVRHSYMTSEVNVISQADFDKWVSVVEKKSKKDELKGLQIIKDNACTGCHSIDGSKIVGPSFKNLYGTSRIVITDNTERTVKADDEYIKTSIIDPNKDVVKDFPPAMKSYKDVLKDEDIKQIIEYLKTPDDK